MSTPFNEEAKEEEKKEQVQEDAVENTEETASEESHQDINWKKFREERKKERERLEQAEKERQEKEKQVEAMQQVMQQYIGQNKQTEAPQWEDEEDEDKKLERKIAEYEQKKEEQRKKEEQERLPQYLRQAHQDFDKVVTQDNVDYFEYHYPEVASAFAHMPESYEKWDKVYKAVKKFVPNERKEMEEKAQKNLSKPQSPSIEGMANTGESAPHALTEAKRKENWRRMRQAMKSV